MNSPALNNPQTYMFISSVSQLITTNIFKMAAAAILNLDTGFDISQIIKITSNMDSVSSITPEYHVLSSTLSQLQKNIYTKISVAAILNLKTGFNVD